ncbi:MAG: band 7 protein [Leptospiraceae bacterium]|nr:band 7 protein [Leptospiraceae bacterium]MCK6382301.1 band 7 protein [Leptospiraceae bacterium]
MFGIKFMKNRPTDFVLLYKKGKIKKQGAGLSFFYYSPTSIVVIVPADTRDAPFIFKETTVDFQEINIQGQISYNVTDPLRLAAVMDFTVDSFGRYLGDGLEKLPTRLTNIVQVAIREKIQSMNLRNTLTSSTDLVKHVKDKLKVSESLSSLGLSIADFSILKISPTPDMSRALEASARENLLKEADDAIYQRRNFAVEQERKIKENELQTQISIEEKNRKILEEKWNAEIAVQEKQKVVEEAKMLTQKSVEQKKHEIEEEKLVAKVRLEEKKKGLVKLQSENTIDYAKARAESMRLELNSLNSLKPELLEILAANQMDSSQILSRALRDIAKNAEKIGNLNISPELLTSLIGEKE